VNITVVKLNHEFYFQKLFDQNCSHVFKILYQIGHVNVHFKNTANIYANKAKLIYLKGLHKVNSIYT